MRAFFVALLLTLQAATPPAPTVEISNPQVRAALHPPDATTGYYRGTRFDRSGVIASLEWNHHQYFGQWFEKYDPMLHDAITGPVEEFLTKDAGLGYDEAQVGEPFVRIGVGAVKKPEEASYQRFNTYEVVDPGTWTVTKGTDRITFVHTLKATNGYAYVYRKIVRLEGTSLILEHSLRNTGRKPIASSVYDHNFFTLDGETTGPNIVVRFPFMLRAVKPLNGLAQVNSQAIEFLKPFERTETVFTEVEGFGSAPKDYDFRIENRRTGAAVRITSNRPLAKLVFWSNWKTSCPEPYIDMNVAPGGEFTWQIKYDFYEAAKH